MGSFCIVSLAVLEVSLAVLEVSLAVCLIPLPSAGATENNSQLVIETHNRRETQLKGG